jgi:FMN phosphatase YigB (HAD superfamily)
MPLTLEQYASSLDTRNLPWPAPPEIKRPKAKPHLAPLDDIRAVTWNVYGTLLAVTGGELYFEHPQKFVMDVALDKTIQEFKMWGSMVRKPGQPTDYLRRVYTDLLTEQRMLPSGTEKNPEVSAERLWEGFIKKLLQKEYQINAGLYGALNEFSRKVAYFFHASLQTPVAYPGAAQALRHVRERELTQGLIADGQCFTITQLQRCLGTQDQSAKVDDLLDPELRVLSVDVRGRKPSERLFRQGLNLLEKMGIEAGQVLHVGSRVVQDIIPARRLGMKTALFAGDKDSLQVTTEQLRDPNVRPDVMLTELSQIAEVVG